MPKKSQKTNTIITEVRPSCFDCVRKHLMQAGVLMLEYRKSDPEEYPMHPLWANAHLAEAEDECSARDAELAKIIRRERLKYLDNRDYQIPIEGLVEATLIKDQE